MDALARNHIRNRLHTAEHELEVCTAAAQHALATSSWPTLASYASQAHRASGLIQAYRDALTAEEGS
jgi:hypothetical protein